MRKQQLLTTLSIAEFASLVIVAVVLMVVLTVAGVYALRWRRFVVHEHQWGLLYKDGKLLRVLEPGAYRLLRPPYRVDTLEKRRQLEVIGGQEVLTQDNLGLKLSLVAEYRVTDPIVAVTAVESFRAHIHHTVQIAARQAVAAKSLDALLENREAIAAEIEAAVTNSLQPLGLEICAGTGGGFMLNKDIRSSYAALVTARKDGEAALERARSETAALRSLANAARMVKDNPDLLQLRVLQTMAAGDAGKQTFVMGVGPTGGLTPDMRPEDGTKKT